VTVYFVVHNVDPLELIPMGDADEDLQGVVPGTLELPGSIDLLESAAVGQVLELDDGYLLNTEMTAEQVAIKYTGTTITMPNPDHNNRHEPVAVPQRWLGGAAGVITDAGCRQAWRLPGTGEVQSLGLILRPREGAANTVAGRRAAREEARHLEQGHAHQAARKQQVADPKSFVNPYNFVPLVDGGPVRAAPEGHLRLAAGNLSGRVDVTFEAVTPLALPGEEHENVTSPYLVNGQPTLPGSSLGGVVRSFHESLTSSCLRIIDPGFRPVHREPARVRDSRWRLAVVEPDNMARLCDLQTFEGHQYPAVWVEGESLPGHPSSTKRYSGQPTALKITRSRLEGLATGMSESPTGQWVPLITAKGARGDDHPYHCALGQLGQQVLEIPAEVRKVYALTAEDAEDVVKERRDEHPVTAVRHRRFNGERQILREHLQPGDVVWVRLKQNRIEEVSRSAIWRVLGEREVRERVGGYLPCSDPEDLCPSCALFGMVEEKNTEDESERGVATQNSYRGHVRFGDASIGDVEQAVTQLVRMGQPRPGSSQFYLDTPPHWHGKLADEGRPPLRDWGSQADGKPPRQIRGRKRYWAQTTAAPKHRLPNHRPARRYEAVEPDEDNANYHLVPAGTHLAASIHFDNITRAQLGALLMSVNPQLFGDGQSLEGLLGLPASRQFVLQFGRGKNVGLGVVRTTALELHTEGASRYGLGEGVRVTVEEAVAAFQEWAQSADAVKTAWPALAAMCMLDRVPPETLTYPPDDSYRAEFQFDFWKKSNGSFVTEKKREGRGFTVLPRADAPEPFVRPEWWG
jgi:CRISPR-associated protein (TIGR03986 family)